MPARRSCARCTTPRGSALLLALLVVLLGTAAPAHASSGLIWEGLAENGMAAWDGLEQARNGRIGTDSAHRTQGAASYRFELRDGEVAGPGSGERAEVRDMWTGTAVRRLRAGETAYIGWRQRFAADFPSPDATAADDWCAFLQLKEAPDTGSPMIGMFCGEGREGLSLGPEWNHLRPWSIRLRRGTWQAFVLRVHLATDRSGSIALWHDGRRQSLRTRRGRSTPTLTGKTIRRGARLMLKMGVYRSTRVQGTAVTHVDEVRVARTYRGAAPGPRLTDPLLAPMGRAWR